MTVYFKQGVQGDLSPKTQKVFGRVAKVYERYGEPMFVTSIRDGNHSAGSFHYIGDAFDIKYADIIPEQEIRLAAGSDCDVIFHKTHIHIERDLK